MISPARLKSALALLVLAADNHRNRVANQLTGVRFDIVGSSAGAYVDVAAYATRTRRTEVTEPPELDIASIGIDWTQRRSELLKDHFTGSHGPATDTFKKWAHAVVAALVEVADDAGLKVFIATHPICALAIAWAIGDILGESTAAPFQARDAMLVATLGAGQLIQLDLRSSSNVMPVIS
jgi:hypothetical protein